MRVKIIGHGFIGSHLEKALLEDKTTNTYEIVEENPDIIFYCSGVMRSNNPSDFYRVNYEMLKECIQNIDCPIVYLSSTQYNMDNDYGRSKRLGESATLEYENGIVYRLCNTFGDGSKPNYNSVVATWMFNIKHDLPILISDPDIVLRLNYIDDVVRGLKQALEEPNTEKIYTIQPVYEITLGDLAETIKEIKEEVKMETELGKKLEKTYKSY